MNRIVERIERESISLQKHYGEGEQYAYYHGKNLITYPAFENEQHPHFAFSLAHELAHYYRTGSYPLFIQIISQLARMKSIISLIFSPFLLWEEIDAWVKAWRICKEEKISRTGFIELAIKCVCSYIRKIILQIFRAGKYVLGIYISTILWIRYLKISEEMELFLPEWLQSIRNEVLSTTQTNQELVTTMFSGLINLWVTSILMYISFKFVWEYFKRRV